MYPLIPSQKISKKKKRKKKKQPKRRKTKQKPKIKNAFGIHNACVRNIEPALLPKYLASNTLFTNFVWLSCVHYSYYNIFFCCLYFLYKHFSYHMFENICTDSGGSRAVDTWMHDVRERVMQRAGATLLTLLPQFLLFFQFTFLFRLFIVLWTSAVGFGCALNYKFLIALCEVSE